MRGWHANNRIDFELVDAHTWTNMTARERVESYVKGKLREWTGEAQSIRIVDVTIYPAKKEKRKQGAAPVLRTG
jgi:hypothetical protein